MKKFTNILFFVLCLVISSNGHTFDGMHSPLTEDLERQVNLINKSHVKSTIQVYIYTVNLLVV
jgi:hypothetical protein